MEVERATVADIPELLEMLHSAFRIRNPAHPGFKYLYPDLFIATEEAAGCHMVIRKQGRLVSCVGTYPMTLRIAGCRVAAAGIGQVGTSQDMQGRGYMSALIEAAVTRLERESVGVSWLGGRHDRYGRYGWEAVHGGVQYMFYGFASAQMDETLLVAQMPTRDAVLGEAHFTLREQATTGEATQENYVRRLGRRDAEFWVAHPRQSEKPVAWAVVFPSTKRIAEACGSPEGILQILRSAALRLDNVSISVSPADTGLSEKLRAACTYMSFDAQMLLVVSLKQVLADYTPLIEARRPKGFSVTLQMQLADGVYEEASVGGGGGTVINLDRKRMARLLFSAEHATSIPGVPPRLDALNTIFPLPFIVPGLFRV